MNPNYDPNTLDRDQKRAKKREKICILSIAIVALLLAVGLGVGLWRMPLRNTSILILYSSTDFSKAPVVLYPDESEFKIFQYIFDINFHFQAGEYWRDSTTNATPKFTIHVQRF